MVLPSHQSNQDKNEEVKIWAVVIGVARYDHMPVLKYADDDVYQIYAFLKKPPKEEPFPITKSKYWLMKTLPANIISSIQEIFRQGGWKWWSHFILLQPWCEWNLLPIDFDGYNNKLYHDEIKLTARITHARHKLCLIMPVMPVAWWIPTRRFLHPRWIKYYSILNKEQGGAAFIHPAKTGRYPGRWRTASGYICFTIWSGT